MQVSQIRLTVRRLMILVMILGMGCGAERLWARRQSFLREAAVHADLGALLTRTPADRSYWEDRWTAQRVGRVARYPWPAGPPFVPAMVRYHQEMRVKYERAARMPWIMVEPDPL